MSLHQPALDKLESHWAVSAISDADHMRATILAERLLAEKTIGRQLNLALSLDSEGMDLLKRVGFAYEMASIEGMSAFLSQSTSQDALRRQCIAGAWRAFEFQRLSPIPQAPDERIFHVLHLASLAYCGDRWSDVRRWLDENEASKQQPSVADAEWQYRLLYRLYDCWIRLLRKRGWDDLDRIREIIAGLREDQKQCEASSLAGGNDAENRSMALRLIAFYNWAKATEILALYMMQGEPRGVNAQLDKHYEAAVDAAATSGDPHMEVLMRWLHVLSRQMVSGSLWWVAHAINSRVTRFVGSVTKHQGLFELLPPQRAALQEQGLLDVAATAVVIDMPTSGGKTLLAQFRILQALNQFAEQGGWVAYIVPTKALGSQITRRLRRDFGPIGIKVEQLTGAVEIDAIEEELLSASATDTNRAFDILVATPEKLQLVIRNKKIPRTLALVVMDEAHNMESESRGLRIELLLATIKQECTGANFLLLMPYVEKVEALARWLADDASAGRPVSLGTSPWRPNEQIVGMFRAVPDDSERGGWGLEFETLLTTRKTIQLGGKHRAGGARPIPSLSKSAVLQATGQQKGMNVQAAAMSKVFSSRGASIAIGGTIPDAWRMAREVAKSMPEPESQSEKIRLVQGFLAAEISPSFELIPMLSRGVAVHHSGLSDEIRALIEWLTEESEVKVLCATTTLAQGLNFPVSSVFLATTKYPYGVPFKKREFWNLAGRAGRMNQDSVGVVGIADANRPGEIRQYVRDAAGELVSQLVTLVKAFDAAEQPEQLLNVIRQEQWEDFRCFVAHLVHEIKALDKIIANADGALRSTYGYRVLQETPEGQVRAKKLLEATKLYAAKLSGDPGRVAWANMTGFSYEGVLSALGGLGKLENKLTPDDFSADRLFGNTGGMADLFGIMLRIPQLSSSLEEITPKGMEKKHLAAMTVDWVEGKSLQDIASAYFSKGQDSTGALSEACKAIYKNLINSSTWGLSALSRMAGFDYDRLSDEQKRRINLMPAMIYHGVKTEEAVLMRMNGLPRSLAENMGSIYREATTGATWGGGVQRVREFLAQADIAIWNRARPSTSQLSAEGYKNIWNVLSGMSE